MRPSFPTLLACLLLAMMSPAHARAAGAATASTTTPAEAVALRDAEALGQHLFRLDRAAWFASDALVAAARGRVDPRVQGWITEERDDGIDVIYVDAVPAALYRVSIDAQGQPTALEARPPPLSPAQLAAAQARATALAAVPASCTGDYNPLTLPGATPRDWRVYLLPVVADGDRVPLGGAWRIDVHDGQVVAQRAFTQGCIALDNQGGDDAFVVSHLLDPIPTEIHVFWSLWADKPMFVTTSQGTWAINEGLIAPVPASPATTPTALDAIGTMGARP